MKSEYKYPEKIQINRETLYSLCNNLKILETGEPVPETVYNAIQEFLKLDMNYKHAREESKKWGYFRAYYAEQSNLEGVKVATEQCEHYKQLAEKIQSQTSRKL